MKEFENLQDILNSISKLRKHLESADYLISYLEADLDKGGAYQYVDSAMYDIKTSYNELLEYVNTLEDDLDDVLEENDNDSEDIED